MGMAMEVIASAMDEKEKMVLAAVVATFGDDTNVVIDALVVMMCKVAMMGEVDPKKLSAGIKQTWDDMAERVNAHYN